MSVLRLSKKGQLLIPKSIRKKMGIEPASMVQLVLDKGKLIIKPVSDDPINDAAGFIQGDFSLTRDLLQERSREKKYEKRRKIRSR